MLWLNMRKMQSISAMSAIEVTELMLNFKVIKKLVLEQVKCDECGKEICNSFILKRQKATVHGIKLKEDFYVFTGSTIGVVPILGKGTYKGFINKLGSVTSNIN